MIVTCTLNPSLDCYMEFEDDIELGKTNRSNLEYYEAGGKGINVSVVLSNLGVRSKALGFLGGFAKDFYISLLSKYDQIQPNFTYIEGNTRINIKCIEKRYTDINAKGPYITNKDVESLKVKLKKLDEGDYFVLGGNTQDYIQDSIKEIIKEMAEEGVYVVLDTNKSLVEECLEFKPLLIKTTAEELEEQYDIDDFEDIVKYGKEMYAKGAKNVIVVDKDETVIFVCDKGAYTAKLVHDEVVNNVGLGDSVVAGFIMNYMRSKDVLDSLKFAAACGSATAYSKSFATREKVDKFYDEVEVKEIDS